MSLCSDGSSSDPYFLLNFIMSNYLGPDLYSDNPRCSASQRFAKRLPPYTSNHIGSSSLTVAQIQNLYHYVLRNAKSSLLLHPDMIHMYLKGYLPMEPTGKFHQFTDYFPTNLHQQKRYSPSHEIVKGIVVIDDPAVAFISKEELERFRCLSRLDDLKIDRAVCLSPPRVHLDESRGTKQDCSRSSNGLVTNQDVNSCGELRETCKRKNEEETVAGDDVCVISKTTEGISVDIPQRKGKEQDQECSRQGEATSNGLVTNHDVNSSGDIRETCKRKKEEEVVDGDGVCVISKTPEAISVDIPQRKGKEQDQVCSRHCEATSCGLVSSHDVNSSGDLRETCKRKNEEDAVAGDDVCVMRKTPEEISVDIPQRKGKEQEQECSRNGEATSCELVSNQDCNKSAEPRETSKRKKPEEEAVTAHASCGIISKTPERLRETYKTYKRRRLKNSSRKATNKNVETLMERDKTDKPTSVPLVIVPPEMKECDAEPAVVTTGTASIGTLGPSVGAVDIGINKVAYFFQVALPGVCKDNGEFSCEIESDGKVILEGSTTTGQKTMERHSRVFKMNNRKLCPPGPFKLSFKLPGPVDPRLVSPIFRSDGIFEAVVIRQKNSHLN